jgi:O-methyltransferase
MIEQISKSARRSLKRVLNDRFRLVILRGQVVLHMETLQRLTTRDSIRVCSLEAVADEIRTHSIVGSVAELGVYQGDFSKHINAAFPDRKLYLFDTFEGFAERDKSVDVDQGFSAATEDFSNTTVDLVLKKMTHPQSVVIRKGYFPDTLLDADRNERFAFVSIDTDLYKPMYEGLEFFFPRLSSGGYIFLHDFNNKDYPGARAAVTQYCREHGVGYFPLVDPCGTAVLCKG